MADLIRGKVARVLNSREVVLNVGSNSGVEVGMYFDILDSNGEDIEDPDTGDSLGFVDRPKVRVRITSVQEKLSVASTYRVIRVNVGGIGGFPTDTLSFSRLLMPPKWETRHETLKTQEKTWEDLEEEESYVKTGDPVIQALATDEVEQEQEQEEEELELTAT